MKKCTFALACCALSVASTLSLAQTPAVAAPSAAQPAPAAPSAESGSPTLVGQVISRTALFQQVAIPHANCVNTPVTVQGPKSGAGAMMGAIAGAAVGSQIGGGSGQALATMAGVVGGAVLGDSIEKAPSQTYNQTTCSNTSAYENRLVGYQVVYEYAGKQYSVQLPQDPGPTIALQLSPVAMGNGTMAQAPMPQGPQMQAGMIPPGATVGSPATTIVTSPQVIYAPPVVYGSPYYYGNPYPFTTSINFGWGFRGGYGRRWH